MKSVYKRFKLKYFTHLLLFGLLILTFSCQDKSRQEDKIKQGRIEYKVRYLENKMKKNIPTNLLPDKMTLKFRDNRSVRHIKGFMGLFDLTIITDHNKKTSISLLKVIGKKYYHQSTDEMNTFCFQSIPGMEVNKGKSRGNEKIAGIPCKKGEVTFNDTGNEDFPFYYTHKIDLEEPNFGNPYHKVDGILMKFRVQFHKLRMELIADKVESCEIAMDEFKKPEGFKRVTKQDMNEILSTLME